MSIIKLTDPRYCSPLDPPLIPTYPPPGGEGRPVFSSNLETDGKITRNWDTQVIQSRVLVSHPRFSKNTDTRPVLLSSVRITKLSVESFQRVKLLLLPLCPFPHLAAYTPPITGFDPANVEARERG